MLDEQNLVWVVCLYLTGIPENTASSLFLVLTTTSSLASAVPQDLGMNTGAPNFQPAYGCAVQAQRVYTQQIGYDLREPFKKHMGSTALIKPDSKHTLTETVTTVLENA